MLEIISGLVKKDQIARELTTFVLIKLVDLIDNAVWSQANLNYKVERLTLN